MLLERIFYKILYNKVLIKTLNSVAPFSITTKDIDVRTIDATDMPFPDGMFDMVISTATFEHILDVPRAISEVKRVMKKGAIAHIGIHLFTSLSGGHNIKTGQIPIVDLPKHIRPWDHLRKRQILPIPANLNRLREHEYKEMFSRKLEILEWISPDFREGEHLLTKEIKEELSDYSEEELLKRWVVVIARKR